ncbi:MAG: hypothetical protein JNM17_39870 [Archangium sp.]|nr:hypothetical protein [Archangium sp.]
MNSSLRALATLFAIASVVVLPACQCQRRAAIETPIAELQSCPEDERCETGLCDAEPGGEKVCLRTCSAGCRQSDVCTTLAADRFACVPERAGLCKTCEADSDCPRLADKCIQLGGAKFCGRDCTFDDSCPSTFRCADSISAIDGSSVGKQCQPVTGDCACTAATTGQQVPCEVTNSAGRCLGVKICEPPSGFTACNAKTPANETCNGLDDDCDGQTDEDLGESTCGVGECLRTTPNCVGGVAQTCVPGTPVMEVCDDKDNNCNGQIDDNASVSPEICDGIDNNCNDQTDEGFNLATDPNNCGMCGLVCNVPGNTVSSYACVGGVCGIGTCAMGRSNCNQQYADGCEIDVTTDVSHCGQCMNACMTPNGTPACVVGACRIGTCNQGFANCNGQIPDGCEVDTTSSVGNCGACNAVCNAANANNSCVNSVCAFTCQPNWYDADGIRTNGCEYACIRTNNGVEQCDRIDNDCDNRIDEDFDLTSNPLHCGMCNRACSAPFATTSCTASNCGIVSCNAGRANCNGQYVDGCEVDTQNTLAHCGGCNQACAPANATPRCNAGMCQIQSCNANYQNCNGTQSDGCEVNTTNNISHCGACNSPCNLPNAVPICSNSLCTIGACLPGFINLNNTALDGCEYQCTVTNNGVEACDGADNDCDGTVDEGFNLSTDINNCGMCGRACSAPNVSVPACIAGSCRIQFCAANFVDCNLQFNDGCEVNTTSNINNCGACGNLCSFPNATPVCSASSCQIQSCNATWRNCNSIAGDGCEINIENNPDACGNCTTICPNRPNSVRYCSLNACGFSCTGGFLDQDGLASNGCEYTCTPTGADDPDDTGTDQNCDGIDGDESRAIFVALTGLDLNPGTKALPKRTIQAGVNAANSSRPHVYVSEGTYLETVTLRAGISIFGGYAATAGWTRSPLYTTTIQQDITTNGRVMALLGVNINTATTVAYVTVRANNAQGTSASTYGVHCVACNSLTLKRVNVIAGSATAGTSGGNGTPGIGAGNGAPGGNGSCDSAAGAGGPGGFSACGRTGGNGGNGGAEGSNNGQTGGQGISGIGGGGAGPSCNANSTLCLSGGCTAGGAGNGQSGSSGGVGSNGAAGNMALLVGQYFVTADGADGTDGADGNGGGGGGGGGGQGGPCVDDGGGNGGGGGGGGGCHGGLARGGTGGGSSFAVFLINSTGMRIENSTLTSSNAGAGGSGGSGGGGGPGGSGASGATACTGEVGRGGNGGNGGSGGAGGHGGGGQGGYSFSLYKFSSNPTLVNVNYFNGSGGAGGASPGNTGATGLSGNFN